MNPRLPALLAVSLALAALAGCSAVGNVAGQPAAVTATEQQARSKAQGLLDATTAHIKPSLPWQAGPVEHTPNYTGIDGHYDGTMRVVLSTSAPVRLAKSRLSTLEADITNYWRQQGFQLQIAHAASGDFGIDATADQVHLTATSDMSRGLTLSADVGTVQGPKDITAVNGTPVPEPTGSDGRPSNPTPTVDPYWSH